LPACLHQRNERRSGAHHSPAGQPAAGKVTMAAENDRRTPLAVRPRRRPPALPASATSASIGGLTMPSNRSRAGRSRHRARREDLFLRPGVTVEPTRTPPLRMPAGRRHHSESGIKVVLKNGPIQNGRAGQEAKTRRLVGPDRIIAFHNADKALFIKHSPAVRRSP